MTFPFEVTINLSKSMIAGIQNKTIKINGGFTTFLGPNGSGKTQLLRGLKNSLGSHLNSKKIRYVSAGRLGPMENYRSDYDGQRNDTPNFDNATFGDKSATKRRHRTETILGDFATLSERPDILIKVQERLRKLFKRDLTIDWDGGHLKVYFARVDQDNNGNYSSAREASGLLHLVAILSALYDDEVGCLLIDEPEVSLHPQLQSFLLDEISKVAGANTEQGKKLVLISTHSTEFIELSSVEQLACIVFCKDILSDPIQIDPTIGEFQSKKLKSCLTRLGQEHKLALFCHTPLLVEGPSDQIMCSAISRKLSLNLEAAGSQILPVTGKGQFPVVVKLMRLIGKTPAILADADALTDDLDIISVFTNQDKANIIANEMGHRDASKFAKDIYNDFCKLVTTNWDDINTHCALHYYWINRDNNKEEIIAKKRSAFCWLFITENEEIQKNINGAAWLNIKNRLSILLYFLEQLGCFILRKGTIEAYYKHSETLTNDEKPNAASYEVNGLMDETVENVDIAYSDIIRSMLFCSTAKEINEAEAIRDLLLAIVSPALASVKKETTDSELQTNSNNLFGAKSSLFNLKVLLEGEDIYLIVELSSNILDVEGFPLKIKKGSNPIEIVNNALKLK
ncbi:MAG: ABC-type polar amino acid transport system ATPase subunit [Flavobacterium sp.]|jgi:ABC-type polar amino acid transport system ATPase subunit